MRLAIDKATGVVVEILQTFEDHDGLLGKAKIRDLSWPIGMYVLEGLDKFTLLDDGDYVGYSINAKGKLEEPRRFYIVVKFTYFGEPCWKLAYLDGDVLNDGNTFIIDESLSKFFEQAAAEKVARALNAYQKNSH